MATLLSPTFTRWTISQQDNSTASFLSRVRNRRPSWTVCSPRAVEGLLQGRICYMQWALHVNATKSVYSSLSAAPSRIHFRASSTARSKATNIPSSNHSQSHSSIHPETRITGSLRMVWELENYHMTPKSLRIR